MKSISLVRTLAIASLVVTVAKSQVIYDNLGGVIEGIDPVSTYAPVDDSFTSGTSLERITGLAFELTGDSSPGTLTVDLFGDSSTSPGTLLATLGSFNDSTISTGFNVYDIALVSEPILAADTRYWIGLSDTGDVSWDFSLQDLSGIGVAGEYSTQSGVVFANSTAWVPEQMSLTVGAVPDAESTAVLLAIAVSGLFVLRRKASSRRPEYV